MDGDDLELEKTRLISLALEFGFDGESAHSCLDRLVQLYGKLFPLFFHAQNPYGLCYVFLSFHFAVNA